MPNLKWSKNDNYDTPFEAWELIFKHIDTKDKIIWLPFYNTGLASTHLNKLKINHIHQNSDFFTTDISFDMIIDNPPFSIKKQVIEHCLKLNRPFCLLLPFDTLERNYIRDKKFSVLIPKKRYKFQETQNSTPVFKLCWFIFNMDLPNQIIYEI